MAILERIRSMLGHAAGPPAPYDPGAAIRAQIGDAWQGWDIGDPGLADYMRGAGLDPVVGAPEQAMRYMPVFRCVDLISSTLGSLPFGLKRRTRTGEVEELVGHPVNDLLAIQPNAWQSPFVFLAQMQCNALLEGNAYALVIRSRERPINLIPLDPYRVTPVQNEDWTVTYEYQRPNGGKVRYNQREILHLRALSQDGIRGVSRVRAAREAIELALATERAATSFFRNGMAPGGVLKHPKTLSAQAHDRLVQSLSQRHQGVKNFFRWLVVEEGMDVAPLPSNAQNSQMVEQRRFQIEEAARAFGVPRPLLMMDDTSWGSGIEQLGILFVRFGLKPWFTAWEHAVGMALLTMEERRQGIYADFDERDLLRGSLTDQAEYYKAALGAGGHRPWMSQLEVRQDVGLGATGTEDEKSLTNPMTQPAPAGDGGTQANAS